MMVISIWFSWTRDFNIGVVWLCVNKTHLL